LALFILAKQLNMTVQMLLENTSSYELTEWFAYLKYEMEEREKQRKEQEARAKTGESPPNFSIFDIPEQ